MIQIKQATSDHLETVAGLFHLYRTFYRTPSDIAECKSFVEGRLSNEEAVVFVALDEETGQGAGFTLLYPSFSSVSLRKILVLNDLYVDEKFRRQGIASELLHTAITYGMNQGAIRLHLETEVSNIQAQALYEKEGWVKESETYHYNYGLR